MKRYIKSFVSLCLVLLLALAALPMQANADTDPFFVVGYTTQSYIENQPGAFCWRMQEKSRKAPNVDRRTLGRQNSHAHSSSGVSINTPGTPFHQKDHPVKNAPTKKLMRPTHRRLLTDQVR